MSAIDKKTVEHIAKLARLTISDGEAIEFSQQLTEVLSYFEQISKVNTEGVEPLITPTDVATYWREDVSKKEFVAEDTVGSAPQRTGNLYTVPPVV